MAGLIKSRQRVIDHGEVFTPPQIVDDMLDLVKAESERVDSRFLEPACGSGNFLVAVLRRKLAVVGARYGGNTFERHHYGLLALMSLYGIELLDDNVAECQANLAAVFARFVDDDPEWITAAQAVLRANIWADKQVTFLGPFTRSGVFLREITKRLIDGPGHPDARSATPRRPHSHPPGGRNRDHRVDGNVAFLRSQNSGAGTSSACSTVIQ